MSEHVKTLVEWEAEYLYGHLTLQQLIAGVCVQYAGQGIAAERERIVKELVEGGLVRPDGKLWPQTESGRYKSCGCDGHIDIFRKVQDNAILRIVNPDAKE